MREHVSILFVAPFNHDHGTEVVTFHVVRAACEQYANVALLYSGGKGKLFREMAGTVDLLVDIGDQNQRANIYRNAAHVLLKILWLRPRVVCAVSYIMGQSVGLAMSLLPRILRPFSILVHHVYPDQRNDLIESARMKRWYPVFDEHVVVSRPMVNEVRPYVGDRAVIRCIPNGVDIYAIERAARRGRCDMALPRHQWRCIYVGGLRVDKRVDRLIRAFAMLPERNETVLLLVGDGGAKPRLMQLANDLDVGDRCVFVGHQSCPFEWYHGCDMFVQTPDWETFGLSLLEAMAAGLPVLTMGDNSPGLQEFLRDGVNGRLIISGDASEFSQAWSMLLRSLDQRQKLSVAGHQTANAYSLDAMVERYLCLFDQQLAQHESG
jgi:glycosyltransferase involved in cell wall biosynthesis